MFQTSVLYKENYYAKEDIVVNQGGTSSGKTYSILQVLFSYAIEQPNQIITIVGQDIPNLKSGALRDAITIWSDSEELKALVLDYNKSDRIFSFKSGRIIEFKSYDDGQDAKNGKRDYLFLNEANGISFDVYNELYMRTKKKTFIDYNPNEAFWVHDKLIGKPNVKLLISDHRHNPFIDSKLREKIENLKETDIELWKVYARGMTGKIEGLVFRNYTRCANIPSDAQLIGYGLDFGFTNDPSACVGVWRYNGELYIKEFVYERQLTNPMLADKLKEQGITSVIADSSEPKSIQELFNCGINASGVKKGADSVRAGLNLLKGYKMNITNDSTNLLRELASYKWKQKNGEMLNEVIGMNDHAIDALRYVALTYLQGGFGQYSFS
jgi:phage terminase large subunit